MSTPQQETKPVREPISKMLRFEVFKRDSFKCQYCGAASPDALLHVDHIRPVCDGGTNEILNLITACEGCNLGKGARLLSDTTIVTKTRSQLEALQARREQIELMMEWQRELMDLDSDTVDAAEDLWFELSGFNLTASGRDKLSKIVKKFGLEATLEAMRISAGNYLRKGADNKNLPESTEIAFSKIGGICELNRRTKAKPYLKDLYYFRNVLKKRLHYCNPYKAMERLEAAFLAGVPAEDLRTIVIQAKNWTHFNNLVDDAEDAL